MGVLVKKMFLVGLLFVVTQVSASQFLADTTAQTPSSIGHYGGHYGHGGHWPPLEEAEETTQENADVVDPQYYGGGYGGYGHGGYGGHYPPKDQGN